MEDEKLIKFMQQQLKDFIDENPVILKAMAQGYEFSMKFEIPLCSILPPKDDVLIKILGSVKNENGTMTLKEFFNNN